MPDFPMLRKMPEENAIVNECLRLPSLGDVMGHIKRCQQVYGWGNSLTEQTAVMAAKALHALAKICEPCEEECPHCEGDGCAFCKDTGTVPVLR